ncbi:SIMPL domain-containing protein [Alteromonas oceanisediminis]|uniref:SIMPL domain-containing protein n=1 Tax=Alteromonas oceanisediminis TaxID=2836180 RepID=UPI001BD9D7D9|nr:SIMPL domain-containing protein [Alteromonas oceanisediminis]MBT0587128.1 SIMPL domain-containing protein [Alteromonas oceanisediminis]
MRNLLLLFTVLFISTSAVAQANPDNATNTISVQGKATVAVVPDAFSVTFMIEERGDTVSKLNQKVTQSTRSIIGFLRSMDVAERHIQTMQIQLNPWYETVQRERQQKGFVLTRTISVSHTELDQYDALIDGVLRSGANRIEQFEFVVQNEEALYLQALSEAMLDARTKAEKLLTPVNAKVGSLVSVSEQQNYAQPRARMMMADAEMSSALPGTQGISASVLVEFTIL